MKTFEITVDTEDGREYVTCKTSAHTQAGVQRALGTAIAKKLQTDVFEVVGYFVCEDVDWKRHDITNMEEYMIWKAAHDVIMDGVLA